MKRVVIIGNGIAGITAARHIRKRSDDEILVISSESKEFFSRTALMYVYMGHMRFQDIHPYESGFWKKNRINLLFDHVEGLETSSKKLKLRSGEQIPFDILIIASGSTSRKVEVLGVELPGVQSLYSYQDLLLLEKNTHPFNAGKEDRNVKHAVIVGGGLIGVELAEMLVTRKIKVTVLVRESHYWGSVLPPEESALIDHHVREHGLDVRYKSELKAIHAGADGRVGSIETKSGERISCELLGLTVGVKPNIQFLIDSGIDTGRGVLVNRYFETNIPGIYAIGDCAEMSDPLPGRKSVEQVWYTGRMMGETLAKTITGERTPYSPGPWFNSAKFFDLEYQTYGQVGVQLDESESQVYWEHKHKRHAIKLIFDKNTRQFKGINCIGIRMRHEVIDQWLIDKKSVDFVLEHLEEANFDPEFSVRFETDIRKAFLEKQRDQEDPKKSKPLSL